MMTKELKANAAVEQGQNPRIESLKKSWYKFSRNPLSMLGLVVVLAVVFVAVFAPYIVPYPEDAGLTTKIAESFQGPSAIHLAGTDEYGRDVFSRMLIGTRSSLVIGLLVLAISVPLGVILGLVAGYYKGKLISAADHVGDRTVYGHSSPDPGYGGLHHVHQRLPLCSHRHCRRLVALVYSYDLQHGHLPLQ